MPYIQRALQELNVNVLIELQKNCTLVYGLGLPPHCGSRSCLYALKISAAPECAGVGGEHFFE